MSDQFEKQAVHTPVNQKVDDAYHKYMKDSAEQSIKADAKTLIGVLIGSLISSVNIQLFVNQGNLVPGGFTGLSVLIQRIALHFYGITIPFAPLSLMFNAIPALFAFKIIGKHYTAFSCLSIVCLSVLVDLIPSMSITSDPLLIAVFGGIVSGVASSFILNSGACSGGTDFIAMCISAKKGISVFQYVMGVNILMILLSGILFGMESALYTIIYQFVGTQTLNYLYKRYEKKTMLIVTDKADLVANEILVKAHHGCTIIKGEGAYSGKEKKIVYAIVSTDQLTQVRKLIRQVDQNAFINILDSSMISGNFYIKSYR